MSDEYILDVISEENYNYYHEKYLIDKEQRKKNKKYLGI